MKCIVFSILLCAVALEAKPYGLGLGLGRLGLGSGLGTGMIGGGYLGEGGLGLGLGAGRLGLNGYNGLGNGLGTLGLGGLSRGQSGYAQGGQFGNNLLNAGSSGIGNQGYLSQGAGGFHDNGFHHSKVTSINQADESDAHSIGGGQAYNTGAQAGGGFNDYLNGANNYGSQFGMGGASQQGFLL